MNLSYNLDCLEALGRMPDKCIDLAVVDPPYFDGPNKRGFYGSKQNKYHTPRVIYPKTDTVGKLPRHNIAFWWLSDCDSLGMPNRKSRLSHPRRGRGGVGRWRGCLMCRQLSLP